MKRYNIFLIILAAILCMAPGRRVQIDDTNVRPNAGIKAYKLDLRVLEFTNMVTDSSFEDWASGTSSQPDGWTAEGTPTVARDTAEQGHGSYVVKLTATGAASEGSKQTITNLKASTVYRLIARAKATSGDKARMITTGAVTNVAVETGRTVWTDLVGHFSTDSSGTDVVVKLTAKASGDIVWFDDIQATQSTTKTGFFRHQATARSALGSIYGGGTAASVLFIDSVGNITEDNADFFYNSTTNVLSVGTLTMTGLTAGRVVFVGAGGALTDDADFLISAAGEVLSVPEVYVTSLVGHGTEGFVFANNTTGALTASSMVIDDIFDVTITSVGNNEILQYNTTGTTWENQTFAEAGISPTAHRHDTHTLEHDAVNSDGGTFSFTTSGTLTFSNTVALTTCADAGSDVDKFLVLDGSNNIDYRTGTETLADISGDAGATFDFNSQIVTGVADAVNLEDAVNLNTLLDHTGIAVNYWLGSTTLDLTLTDSEASYTETPNAEDDELSNIYFKSSVAETPSPFLIKADTIIAIHWTGDETSAGGRNVGLYFQLGYVNADGTTTFVQIGGDSDTSDVLTGDKTAFATHIHVPSDTTVPSGKRLWLKVFSITISGAGGYPTIRVYYDNSAHHMTFDVAGSVLGSFVKRDGTTAMTANWDIGNYTLTANGITIDGTLTDGTASLSSGSLTSVKLGTLTSNGFVKTSSSDGTLSVDTTAYQASDAELTAIAGLTSAADRYIRFTGSGSADLRTYANVLADLSGDAGAAFSFNDQALTSVGAIGCDTITLVANEDVVASGSGHITSGSEGFIVGTLTITDGSIDDTDGTIAMGSTNLTGVGEVTIIDGSSINLQEAVTFTGATTESLIEIPDNLADALSVKDASANNYQQFISTTGILAVKFAQEIYMDAGQIWQTDKVAVLDVYTDDGINAGIDVLSTEGGLVIAPEGTYTIDAVCTIDQNNTVLRGTGMGNTIFNAAAWTQDAHVIDFNGKDYCEVSDMKIVGQDGAAAAFDLISDGAAESKYAYINNVWCLDSDRYGLHFSHTTSDYGRIVNSIFENADNAACRPFNVDYWLMQGNIFMQSQHGLNPAGLNHRVIGNLIQLNSERGINSNVTDSIFSGNIIGNNTQNAVHVGGDRNAHVGFLLYDNGRHGINNGGDDCLFVGGLAYHQGNTYNDFNLSAAHSNAVVGCYGLGVGGGAERGLHVLNSNYGLYIGNLFQAHDTAGIELAGTSNHNIIFGNQLNEEAVARIVDSSGQTNNIIWDFDTGNMIITGNTDLTMTSKTITAGTFTDGTFTATGGNFSGVGTIGSGAITSTGTSLFAVAGIGIARTEGTLHAHTASAGAITASTLTDDIIIENSTHAGLSILSADSSVSSIYFGNADGAGVDNNMAYIEADYNNTRMTIGTAMAGGTVRLFSADAALAATIGADQVVTFEQCIADGSCEIMGNVNALAVIRDVMNTGSGEMNEYGHEKFDMAKLEPRHPYLFVKKEMPVDEKDISKGFETRYYDKLGAKSDLLYKAVMELEARIKALEAR